MVTLPVTSNLPNPPKFCILCWLSYLRSE